jgi:shikimate dehydrogenase
LKKFGLIGYPLSHSFSKKYFESKFKKEGISDSEYHLFEIGAVEELKAIINEHPELRGLNVTIPFKKAIIPLLDELDSTASETGAVNVISISNKRLTGFNSDVFGFENSLKNFIPRELSFHALILGTGGASLAVQNVFKKLGIRYRIVSRSAELADFTYQELKSKHLLGNYRLIVNTTPSGMFPQETTFPDLPYEQITSDHYCYDLVYNPEFTMFLTLSAERGARTKNGLEMLMLQAEEAWRIWNR